ncbi:UNVERIFIED_CONTAM: hypothetical protein FKN15_061102 [Acipenser sinensis]
MAVPGLNNAVRVRLHFDYPPPGTPGCRMCWLYIDLNKCRVVTDLASIIRDKFDLSRRTALDLFIEDCFLPPNESIYVIRDNDSIRVKAEGFLPALNGTEPSEPSPCKGQKRRRSVEDVPSERDHTKKSKKKKSSRETPDLTAQPEEGERSEHRAEKKKKKKKKKKKEKTREESTEEEHSRRKKTEQKEKTSPADTGSRDGKKPSSSSVKSSAAPSPKPAAAAESSSEADSSKQREVAKAGLVSSASLPAKETPVPAVERSSAPAQAETPSSDSSSEDKFVIKKPQAVSGLNRAVMGNGRGRETRLGMGRGSPLREGRGLGRGDGRFPWRGSVGRGLRGGRARGAMGQCFSYDYNGSQQQQEKQHFTEKASNTSVILQYPAEEAPKTDYSSCPLLAAPPQMGQKIAFKLLELTENYTPEVSEYKEGKIIHYIPHTNQVELEILSSDTAAQRAVCAARDHGGCSSVPVIGIQLILDTLNPPGRMDGNGFPDQEQLLQFLKKLKEVFDVCDEDDDGYIRVEHFIDLGLQFGQGDEVQKLTKYLDPHELGRINFKDFCHGVFAIKGCEEILKNALGARSARCRPYEAECEEYNYQRGEEVLGRPYVVCDRAYGDCKIFPPDLVQGLDGGLIGSGSGWRSIPHNPSAASDLSTRSTASLISNEEQFEDYGEGEDVDYTPSSPCPDDETRTNGFSDLGSSVSSSAGQTPRKMRHAYNNDMLDVYCSQCCKKINLLNDLEARLKNLKANSPNRKITSTAFGRQLFHNSNFSSSNGSTEDLFRDSIDSCENDITEKVSSLEKKVTELENESSLNGDLKGKLKQENTQLVHRVQQLEDENGEMGSSVNRLKSQTEKLDEERQRMTYKLEDTSLRLKDEMDLYKKMMDKLRQNRHEFQKEREATQELIEDLRKELEHLQLFKLETERPSRGRSSSSSLSEFNAKTREMELEHEIKRLKQENQKLREQNDDLNGQILSLSLYEAKNLFATHTKAQSLAAEIDNASRDELMEALKEQEEINFRLRQYMDKIILAILDHNPSILEIKD